MRTNISYCKETDDYNFDDNYGGISVDIPTVKKLLRLIKKTHPELLERIK